MNTKIFVLVLTQQNDPNREGWVSPGYFTGRRDAFVALLRLRKQLGFAKTEVRAVDLEIAEDRNRLANLAKTVGE